MHGLSVYETETLAAFVALLAGAVSKSCQLPAVSLYWHTALTRIKGTACPVDRLFVPEHVNVLPLLPMLTVMVFPLLVVGPRVGGKRRKRENQDRNGC